MNTDSPRLDLPDFQGPLKLASTTTTPAGQAPREASYAMAMAEAERRILRSALRVAEGKVVLAARNLGMGRATFYKRMQALREVSPFGE